MKKVFIVLAILCLGFGTFLTITDYKESVRKAEAVKNYPVIDVTELKDYVNKRKTQEMIVTGIACTGTIVTDPKEILEGEYYYISGVVEEYRPDEDEIFSDMNSEANWGREKDLCYEVIADNLATTVSANETLDVNSVFGKPLSQVYYPDGNTSLYTGKIRYRLYSIGSEDKLSAIMTVGDGEAKLHPLIDYREDYLYICGDENAVYKHMDDFLVGDSYLFVIVGVILALLFGFLAYCSSWSKSPLKRVGEQVQRIKRQEKDRKTEYSELSTSLKKRYWKLKIIGAIGTVVGLFLIVTGRVIIGTIILILGVSAWMMSAPDNYNSSTDMVQMIAMNYPRKIEEFYEAYKNVDTPLGSGYLATFYTMTKKALVFGPDDRGQFLYFWLTKDGTIGYLGYSPMSRTIKSRINEPLIPVRSDFTENTSEFICFHSDVVLMQRQLKKSIEHFVQSGEVLPLHQSKPSEVYTFTEDFKLTGQHFSLCDCNGNLVYEIDGTAPLKSFRLYDQSQNEVFMVTKELLHMLPTYQFYYRGEPYGTLEKEFTLVKDRFTMEISEGTLELIEYAGYIGHNFYVTINDRAIGSIMDDLEFTLNNLVFDNAVIIVYEQKYLPLLTAMAIMVAREIARDRAD